MTDEELAAIEARAGKAFRAPWTYTRFAVVCDHEEDCGDDHEVLRIESPDEYPDGQIVADVPGLERFAEANGEFIAHARSDIPALIAEVRRLRAEREEAETWRAFYVRELSPDASVVMRAIQAEEREAWIDAARQCLTENARKELFRLALARSGK